MDVKFSSVFIRYKDTFNITALFTNMRILKFESQLTIAFFAAVLGNKTFL